MTLLQHALKYYGQFEVPGPGSNPLILQWIKEFFPDITDDSKVAWCSIFLHIIAKEAGYNLRKDGTARSWLTHGEVIQFNDAEPGDIVIFWRGSPGGWQGHVALFVNWKGDDGVRVLGGNQSDGVNIRTYQKNRILGIRRLKK